MEGESLESVTMVSALPARVALSELAALPDGAGDGDWEPYSQGAGRQHRRPDPQAGLVQTLHGCSRELLEALPVTGRHRVSLGSREPAEVAFVSAFSFIAAVADLAEAAGGHALGHVPGDGLDLEGHGEGWPGDLARLWQWLNLGKLLLLRAGGDVPAEAPRPAASPDPYAPERAIDRLPPLRLSRPGGIHRVPAHVVVVDGGESTAPTTVDAVRGLLSGVADIRVCAPGLEATSRRSLQARFGADPRLLDDDSPLAPGAPFVLHVSPEIPLTGEILSRLVRRNLESDVGVLRIFLADTREGSPHLSLTRTAAVHHTFGVGELRMTSQPLARTSLDEIARVAGIEWALPEQVGLDAAGGDRPADILGSSAGLPQRDLTLVARLQSELLEERAARRTVEKECDGEVKARRRAEARLARPFVRTVARIAGSPRALRSRLSRR